MFRPWLSLLAWLLVVVVVRIFWLVDLPSPLLALNEPVADAVAKLGLWVGVPAMFLMAVGWQSPARTLRELGLGSGAGAGYAFGLLATMPMMLALPLASRASAPELDTLADSVLLGPFAEEVLFRGFLLAFLVRRAGWSLWIALAATSFAFGLAHVSDADLVLAFGYGHPAAFARVVAEVLLGSIGGLLFGWVYYRWGSLWYGIGLHATVNLWWEVSSGRAASSIPNPDVSISAAHIASFALAVVITVWWDRRRTPVISGLVN
jgi:membrane protease YdiL (CAAX protease family)